jgi:hypothetical protein
VRIINDVRMLTRVLRALITMTMYARVCSGFTTLPQMAQLPTSRRRYSAANITTMVSRSFTAVEGTII